MRNKKTTTKHTQLQPIDNNIIYFFQCHFVDLVHYMAGNVRRDFKSNVTHVVANVIGGEKYEVNYLCTNRVHMASSLLSVITHYFYF